MNLFRITKPKYAQDLSGTGAKRLGGRWNPVDQAMVYTAASSALSLLEHLTHLSRTDMGLTFQLILLETYNTPITLLEDHFATIPAHWKHDQELTRAYGSQWLLKKHSPILRVPSVHSPWEYNYLLNPDHPQLDVEIVDTSYYIYDARFIPKPYYRRLFAKDCGMVITTNHACDRTFRGFNDGFETASLLSTFP